MSDFDELRDILNNSRNYIADEMAEFSIDGVSYRGYTDYTFIWEHTFVKQLERSSDGSMGNLETYDSFVTPRMKVTYDIMPITTYRKFRQQYLNKSGDTFAPNKHFTVDCYDPDYDRKIRADMYLATPSEPKFITRTTDDGKVELIGVQNYTIELIGTNNDDNK